MGDISGELLNAQMHICTVKPSEESSSVAGGVAWQNRLVMGSFSANEGTVVARQKSLAERPGQWKPYFPFGLHASGLHLPSLCLISEYKNTYIVQRGRSFILVIVFSKWRTIIHDGLFPPTWMLIVKAAVGVVINDSDK